jgi:hypothetical protein
MTGIVISSGCEKSFPCISFSVGERKVMKHFVVRSVVACGSPALMLFRPDADLQSERSGDDRHAKREQRNHDDRDTRHFAVTRRDLI